MNTVLLLRSVVVGSSAALLGSAVLAGAITLFLGFASHPLEAASWLFAVAVVPSAVVAVVVAMLGESHRQTGKGIWWVAVVSAIAVVVLAGSVGAITVQSLRFGLSGVNWLGYLQWCGVYGVALLPFTLPFAWGATRLLWRQNNLHGVGRHEQLGD